MLIAVVSDTHRDSYAIEKVLKKVGKADVLIHLGDNVEDVYEISKHFKGRTLFVRGNCDFGAAAKSEAIREMFDFIPGKDKLKSRTRINLKQAHAFAMQRTILAMLDPNETRLAPEIHMDEYMTHVLSVDGKSRLEGMSIFQYQQEEKDIADSVTG